MGKKKKIWYSDVNYPFEVHGLYAQKGDAQHDMWKLKKQGIKDVRLDFRNIGDDKLWQVEIPFQKKKKRRK